MAAEVWSRLGRNRTLAGLALGTHEGRVDLRGLAFEDGSKGRAGRPIELESAHLQGLDLSGARLPELRLLGGTVDNCRLDGALLDGVRIWGVDLRDSSFMRASLRRSVLGGWLKGRGNTFRNVDFSNAHLQRIVTPTALFEDCIFGQTTLANAEFDSDFVRCVFSGRLQDVYFYANGVQPGKRYPNRIEDVDFRDASFRWVGFKGFDLERVAFPVDPNHVVVEPYRCVLERVLAELKTLDIQRGAIGLFEEALKWAGPNQVRGLFNQLDLAEVSVAGEPPVIDILRQAIEVCRAAGRLK